MNKTYEGLFIFPESFKDDAVDAAVERVKAEIEKQKGSIREVTKLGKRGFARPLKKQLSGSYVRLVFEIEPDKIVSLRARYRLMEDVFRVQIVRVEETLIAVPQSTGGSEEKSVAVAGKDS